MNADELRRAVTLADGELMYDGELVILTDAHGVRWDYSPKRDHETLLPVIAERLIEQIRQAHPFSALVACSEWTGDGWLFECEISDNCIRSHEPQFRAIVREGDTLNAAITRACMAVLQ